MKAVSPPGPFGLEDYVASPIAPWKTGGDAYHQMVGTLYDYWACWTTCAIADLSIADHLAGESLTAAEVAARAGSAPETTLRLMRAGVAIGLLTEQADGRFGSTPLLDTLRTDDPRSLRPLVLSQMGSWLPWDQLAIGIREGSTRSTKAFGGKTIFDYLAQHPDEAERFSAGMSGMTAVWGPAIADAIDTTGVQCAVDVGGAKGSLLQLLQHKNPALSGIVFDRPNIVEHAEAEIARNGFADRTRTSAGASSSPSRQGICCCSSSSCTTGRTRSASRSFRNAGTRSLMEAESPLSTWSSTRRIHMPH